MRKLKRNRIKIRTDSILASPPQIHANNPNTSQYLGGDRNTNEPEMIEMNQTSIPRRVNMAKSLLTRIPSSQRLHNIFVAGAGVSDTSSNPRSSITRSSIDQS